MNGYKSFKIPLYFHILGWDKFIQLKVEHVHYRLICLFFADAKGDEKVLEITSYM